MHTQFVSFPRGGITWLLAVLIGLLLSSSYLLDGPDELTTQQLISQDEREAQKSAANELMRERAANQFCVRTQGPGAVASWGDDNVLHCRRLDKSIRQASLSI